MALKKCRECAQSVSTDAKTCPHCGVKHPVKQTSAFTKLVVFLFVLGIIGKGMGGGGGGTSSSAADSPSPAHAERASAPAIPACEGPQDGDQWARVRTRMAYVYYPKQSRQIGSLDDKDLVRLGPIVDSTWIHVSAPVVIAASLEDGAYVMHRSDLCRVKETPSLDADAYDTRALYVLPSDITSTDVAVLDPSAIAQNAEVTVTYKNMLGNPNRPIRFVAKRWYTTRGMARQDLTGWYDWIRVAVVTDDGIAGSQVSLGEPLLVRQGRRSAARRLLTAEAPSVSEAPPVILYAGSTSVGVDIVAIEPSGDPRVAGTMSWTKAICAEGGEVSIKRSQANSTVRAKMDSLALKLCSSP